MTAVGIIIWIFYIAAVAVSIRALRTINITTLSFMDGLLFGSIYYIAIPMFFILMQGELYPDYINADSYLPYKDLNTTIVLLIGMYMIPILSVVTRRKPRGVDVTDSRLLPAMLILFAGSTIYAAISAGAFRGGHWYHGVTDAMINDSSFLLIKHVANFARTAVFAVLFYSNTRGWISRRQAALYGLMMVFADMFLTFNRITAVYYLLMLALTFRNHRKILILSAACGLPALAVVSSLFPMFRGLLSVTGTSVDGMIDAATMTLKHYDTSDPFVTSMNGVFESSNIVVLNFVVQHCGKNVPLLNGDMLIRPLTFFLPKSIWANRPESFGVSLGSIINKQDDLALNSTMFGEPFANFGNLWFIALAGVIITYNYLFKLAGGRYRATGFIAAFIGFAMWRFDTVFGVICLVLTAAVTLGLRLSAGSQSQKSTSKLLRRRRTMRHVGR